MAKKAGRKPTVHLTERALRDIAGIEAHSIEQFGKRVANQYIDKLEAGLVRIAENSDLLRSETPFHESFQFYRVEKHLLVCETGIAGKIIVLTVLHASMDIPGRLAEVEATLSLEIEMLLRQLRGSS